MHFLSLDELPRTGPDVEFKESIAGRLTVVVVFSAVCTAVLVAGNRGYLPERWSITVTVICGLGVIAGVGMLARALGTSNWLVQIAGDQMRIKFRSYLNHRFASNEIQIVVFDRNEIGWVRPVTARSTIEDNTSTESEYRTITCTYLEIGLRSPNAHVLDEKLRQEERHPAAGNRIVRSKTSHYPVSVVGDDTIRVCWKDASSCVAPKLENAIGFLSRWTNLRLAQREEINFSIAALEKLPSGEQSARLRQLVALDQIAAARLTRAVKGCSLFEAIQFLKGVDG